MSAVRRRFIVNPLTPIGEVADLFSDDEDEIEVQVGNQVGNTVLIIRRLRETSEKSKGATDPDNAQDDETQ